MERLSSRSPDREAQIGDRRNPRLAITVPDPYMQEYPKREDCPNTYWIRFVDGEFPKSQGRQPHTVRERQKEGNQFTLAHNTIDGLDAYVPQGTLIDVFSDLNATGLRQWWFTRVGGEDCGSSSSSESVQSWSWSESGPPSASESGSAGIECADCLRASGASWPEDAMGDYLRWEGKIINGQCVWRKSGTLWYIGYHASGYWRLLYAGSPEFFWWRVGPDPMGEYAGNSPMLEAITVGPCVGSSSSGSEVSSGSDKSTAIVPASWSPTGFTALFVAESPEVRFDDVVVCTVPRKDATVSIDRRLVEVCEPGSLEVCGVASDVPVAIGASVEREQIILRFAEQTDEKVRIVLRLTGIRKGFRGHRFPDRTRAQFEANERFIRSAYPGA